MTRAQPLIALLLSLSMATPGAINAQGNSGGQGNGPAPDVPGRGPSPRDTLVVEFRQRQVDYVVDDLSGPPGFVEVEGAAEFRVNAAVPYAVIVTFPTWQPDPPAPAAYRQPEFDNGSYRIGGRIYVERRGRRGWGPPVWAGVPGGPDWGEDGPGRGPPPRDADGTVRFYQDADGMLAVDGSKRTRDWRVGADLGPLFTDHPTGLPEPGTYSVDVVVTIQPQ